MQVLSVVPGMAASPSIAKPEEAVPIVVMLQWLNIPIK